VKRGYIKRRKKRKREPQMFLKSYSLRMIEKISIYVHRLENKDFPNSLTLANQ